MPVIVIVSVTSYFNVIIYISCGEAISETALKRFLSVLAHPRVTCTLLMLF